MPVFDLGVLGVSAALAIAAAVLITVPEFSLAKFPLLAGVALATALLLPPTEFLVASFLFFALLQLFATYEYSAGPANVFLSDLFLGTVVLRGFSPRDRVPMPGRLGTFTLGAFSVWAVFMVIAMARGVSHGAPLDTVIRYASPLFYWPALYFGFSRVLRERDVDLNRLVRLIVVAGLALTAYMFLMRALNRPFESTDPTRGHLGEVTASSGHIFHRDFGFWSAFIVYPIVALIAAGKLLYSRRGELAWLTVASVSILATLMTLVRSEIYGLIAGLAVLFLLSKETLLDRTRQGTSSRLLRATMIGSVVLAVCAVLAAVNPGLAGVIGERSIPYYTHQSAAAKGNAEYRLSALERGVSVAGDHVAGLGVLSPTQLWERGIDPELLVHSGPATLLVFLGWPGLIAAALALLGLMIDSSRAREGPWHPILVGIIVMLVLNSFGAVGIVGQDFVMGIAALIIALRFALFDSQRAE
jgi:hypothetical protein